MIEFALAEILSLKRWEHALFTTYMLSLTFFESYVLRLLRQQGCREIFLIVDADGYQMSLSERRSNRVGQDYRLIPVALPKGVFHPKCMYLSSKEGDLLAIGSGNMTFGGFGRNLEVFDILEPVDAPQAFFDFADFLEMLDSRDDFIIPDTSWISRFALFARSSANGLPLVDESSPKLLHTAVEPIINQISSICSLNNGSSKVTVLSPFHDPEGTAIHSLASRISATQIEVALPPKQKHNTTFPFPKAASWGIPVSAVKPVAANCERPLHAKWIEIALNNGRKLTLTGSINATSKALCSTDNIEVGVIRINDGSTSWALWEKASIPAVIDKHVYRTGGLGQKCLIHANIRNDGVLRGSIIATGDVSGEWSGYLENGTADQVPLILRVNENNRFEQTIQGGERVIYSFSLQLILFQGERRARGWVNQEDILKLSRDQRSIIRLINRDETIDDDIALLDYLSLSANRHLTAFSKPISIEKKGPKSDKKDGTSNISIKLADIAPDSELMTSQDESAASEVLGYRSIDIITQLRRRLLGHRIVENVHSKSFHLESAEDDDADHIKDKRASLRQLANKLETFDICIRECVEKAPNLGSKRAALVIWFEVKLHMLQRHREREKALCFIREWFWKTCSQKLHTDEIGPLEQHLFTVAAIFAELIIGAAKEQEELVALHGELERFAGGDVNRTLAEQTLLDHPDIGFSTFLLGSEDFSLQESLHKILTTETKRKLLKDALSRYKDGLEIEESSIVFSSNVGNEFLAELKRGRTQSYKEMFPGLPICPFCYLEHTVQAKQYLKFHRIAQCANCNGFTVNLLS